MRKLLLVIKSVLLCYAVSAQIPNPDFENWNNTSMDVPQGWRTFGAITQVPGNSGNYAVKMEYDPANPGNPGVIIYGNPDGDQFYGGVPFAARPDSVAGYFKYNIVANDTAWALIVFKNNGTTISSNLYYITGSNTSGFLRKSFKINYSSGLTPDTVIIGFTSTNPDNSVPGGYMIVDDISFIGTGINVPNPDFENWTVVSYDEPAGWYSENARYTGDNIFPVTKTTDSYHGIYAARIENVLTPAAGRAYGYIMAGRQGSNGPLPGFRVTQRETSFQGYYKFNPQNGDTLSIGVMMYYNGQNVGGAQFLSSQTVGAYTKFQTTIGYQGSFSGTPDSAAVYAAAFKGGGMVYGSSVLYIDSVSFGSISIGVAETDGLFNSMNIYTDLSGNTASIDLTLKRSQSITIKLISLSGEVNRLLINEKANEGRQNYDFNISGLASGIYFVSIEAAEARIVKKLTIIR